MRILGIDPGSRVTGWAILDVDGWTRVLVGHGVVRPASGLDLAGRLAHLAAGLREVLLAHGPDACAVEQVFSAKNARSALVLGHARGIALLVAAESGVPVHEYTALQVKQAVTGYGRAEKGQVQRALAVQLGLPSLPRPVDASDALAVALCHSGAARVSRLASLARSRR